MYERIRSTYTWASDLVPPKARVHYVHRHGFKYGVFSETHTKFVHANIVVKYRAADVSEKLKLQTRDSFIGIPNRYSVAERLPQCLALFCSLWL